MANQADSAPEKTIRVSCGEALINEATGEISWRTEWPTRPIKEETMKKLPPPKEETEQLNNNIPFVLQQPNILLYS